MSNAEDQSKTVSVYPTDVREGMIAFGGYELVKKIHWPWLAEPWRANDPAKKIADPVIALVPETFCKREEPLAALREVVERNCAAQHPNLVPTCQWIEGNGGAAIAMSFGRASNLAQLLAARPGGFYEVAHLKFWLAQLCKVLADCHAAGLLHGWLTPRDLLISSSGDLLVANFGVTRLLARSGLADEKMQSALSPQAADGEEPTASDDVYSLGALIYELLTGASVFTGPKIGEKILHETPASMAERRKILSRSGGEVPAYFEEIIAACLAKKPDDRPSSIRDVARRLGLELPGHRMAALPALKRSGDQSSVAVDSAKYDSSLAAAGIEAPAQKELVFTKAVENKSPTIPSETESVVAMEETAGKSSGTKWLLGMLVLFIAAACMVTIIQRQHEKPADLSATPAATPQPAPANLIAKTSPAPSVAKLSAAPSAPVLPTSTPAMVVANRTPVVVPTPTPKSSEPLAVLPDNLPNLSLLSPGSSQTLVTASPRPSVLSRTNSLGMKFVPVGDVMFCIWDTRVKDFKAFVQAVNIRNTQWEQPDFEQGPDHPVVYVSWDDAMAFCKWLTDKEHRNGLLAKDEIYRLPTDLEWSKAVGLQQENGNTPESRDMGVPDVYPWGTQWPPPDGAGNYTGDETGSDVAIHGYDDGFVWTSPVGSFKPNAYGLYDMGGNVWQWCMDYWNNAHRARVLRGGSWYNGSLKLSLLSSCRVNASQDSSTDNYGFRVVIAPAKSFPPSGKP